jgi:hypothetical protein
MAQSYNPSYSGGRDQEDCGLKSTWAKSSDRLYLEKPFTKTGLVKRLKVKALSSSPPKKCQLERDELYEKATLKWVYRVCRTYW